LKEGILMKIDKGWRKFAAACTLATLVLTVSHARAAEDVDIVQKVKSAKTAADHEAIAKYYEDQAAAAKKKAADHKTMGESYRGMGTATGKSSGFSAMPQHCDSLTKSFTQEAAEYEAMAKAHRDLAKAAK
jgi:hypothetical protein